jgi:hypothetical protein
MDGTRSVRISSRNTPFSPTKSSWPIKSSRDFGRIRSASGIASSAAFRFTFFDTGKSLLPGAKASCADRSIDGGLRAGHGACGAPRFLEWLEKNPPRRGNACLS